MVMLDEEYWQKGIQPPLPGINRGIRRILERSGYRADLPQHPATKTPSDREIKRHFRKVKHKMDKDKGLYIVFEINSQAALKHGVMGPPQPEDYYEIFMPGVVGAFEAKDGQSACVEAARHTRRLGNYAAVEVTPMGIDFKAGPAQLEKAISLDDNE